MKTCKRLLDFVQIINAEGDIRLCGWNYDNIVGNLINDDFPTILNGEKARRLRGMIARGDFSNCQEDNCPYLANDSLDKILVEYDEDDIFYPKGLRLAYEGNCNYHCTCCTSYKHMVDTRNNDYEQMYDILEQRIYEVLPYVKIIGANGKGELFCSPRIMKILSDWRPKAPKSECMVAIETNGSLFNEINWKKIKNIGEYYLKVNLTVMSFDEITYQYLSGTKLPIQTIEDNLKFVSRLRREGIINELELATVMQELNFREMPEFTRRCLEEFGADVVRIRPVIPGGYLDEKTQWFMDIRNPLHPYNKMLKAVFEHPIFKDERVLLWSGDLPSIARKCPDSLAAKTDKQILNKLHKFLDNPNGLKMIEKQMTGPVAIYGLGLLGKVFLLGIKDTIDVKVIYDKSDSMGEYFGIPVKSVDTSYDFDGTVIITPNGKFEEMKQELITAGYCGENIISLDSLLYSY